MRWGLVFSVLCLLGIACWVASIIVAAHFIGKAW